MYIQIQLLYSEKSLLCSNFRESERVDGAMIRFKGRVRDRVIHKNSENSLLRFVNFMERLTFHNRYMNCTRTWHRKLWI